MATQINSFFKPFFLIFTAVIMLTAFFSMPVVANSVDTNAPQSTILAKSVDTNASKSIIKSKTSYDDIVTIIPSSSSAITVISSGTTTISYTATAHAPLQHIAIDAGFGMPASVITTSLAADNCSGHTLMPNASCTFNVVLQGVTGKAGSMTLMPRLSANSGSVYAIPSSANRVAVTVSSAASKTLISIAVTPSAGMAGAAVGGTVQFTATGTYWDNSTQNITTSVNWTSSNTSFATIGLNTGLAMGVAAGTTSITATDPATHINAISDFQTLLIGSAFDQGYVYCLGTSGGSSCAYLPSGNNPSTGVPYVGEVIAATDLIASGTDSWQADTSNVGLIWGGHGTTIGSGAQSSNNGQSNTQAIYANLTTGSSTQANSYAAGICTIYNSGDNNNTWYLPAKDELNVIYQEVSTLNAAGANLNTNGITGIYWSSTEENGIKAWYQYLSNGVRFYFSKNTAFGVRCVRAF